MIPALISTSRPSLRLIGPNQRRNVSKVASPLRFRFYEFRRPSSELKPPVSRPLPGFINVTTIPMTIASVEQIEERLRVFTQAPIYFDAGELTETESVYETERQLMRQAIAKRKREFYSGRSLARNALARAGLPVSALPRGPLGNPIWPDGAIGSITHDHRYGAVVVAARPKIEGIGIDLIEDPGQVDDELASIIMTAHEKTLLESLFPNLPPVAVAFSVKESVVKASSVNVGRFIDLLEIELIATGHGLCARVTGLPFSLPCIIVATELGMLTCSYFCDEN